MTADHKQQPPDSPDFFTIDPNRLDEEWLEQPRRYRELALQLADANERLEREEAEVDLVKAEAKIKVEERLARVEKAVRADPAAHGCGKREKDIEGAVLLHLAVRKARRIAALRIRDAKLKLAGVKHDRDVAKVAVDTMDHRKRALEKAVDLFLAGYFATPRAKTATARDAIDEAKQRKALDRRNR